MAENCNLEHHIPEPKAISHKNEENFCIFNVFCVFISLITILADMTTEVLVLAEYCKNGYLYWAASTLLFLLAPNVIINIFSLRWIVIDQEQDKKIKHWITHCFLIGIFVRYAKFLLKIFSCKNIESMKSKKLFFQRNDLSMLHFLYSFTGTVPQIILQSYAILILPDNHNTKAFSLTASGASVIWACATYIYSITSFKNENFKWNSVYFKLMWHFGMLIARLSGIILFTTVFGFWTFVFLGLHWAAMTFWIITQKTTFCTSKLEETFYNIVMGFVYCFCYINLRDGHTRYRLIMFHSFMITQNFGSLFLYILTSDTEREKKLWSVIATSAIVIGTLIGMCGMIFYYRWFHEKGPISWKSMQEDVELNNKVINPNKTIQSKNSSLNYVRSFKSQKTVKLTKNERIDNCSGVVSQSGIENADKKFLLKHWIAPVASATFISKPVSNNSLEASSIEFHTVENTPTVEHYRNYTLNQRNMKIKKKSICSPDELRMKLTSIENMESTIDEITSSNLSYHSRINLISIEKGDLNSIDNEVYKMNSNDTDCKKTASDSIDMDLDLSISDINSSDINTFNENIVQKLCLSALKNIKFGNEEADIENIQRIALDILNKMYSKKEKKEIIEMPILNTKQRELETPTESLSVHDYENICAVNIAREAWGLRSWNGYSDIENWIHDGSIFRERRRDTLTSASSEISSCISMELKNYMLNATPFPKKTPTYCNITVKYEKKNQDDYANIGYSGTEDSTFLARPCMVEGKDSSQLEPILEELDDLCETNDYSKKQKQKTESSLVATIDEIHKVTVTNSPRNLYHRRDHIWDSPHMNSTKIDSNIKRALWKEPSKYNSNNIMKKLTKENDDDIPQGSKLITKMSEDSDVNNPSLPSGSQTNDQLIIKNRNIGYFVKSNMTNEFQDLSNKDIDLLWKLVSVKVPTFQSTLASSMQSLISKESKNNVPSRRSTTKKNKNKPRRKISILKEKFEPRINSISEQKFQNVSEIQNVIQVKNYLDICEISSKNKDVLKNKKINLAVDFTIANASKDIKEKRTLFMKQILSSPKYNTRLRHKM